MFSLKILWISSDIAFLTIPCVSHDSIFVIDLIRQSWIHWHCGFHMSTVTQFSMIITRCTVTLFSVMIYGSAVTQSFWQLHGQPWLYFCYQFDASVVNSLTLSIPYGSCHSVFIDDFKVCSDSVFTDDLWISYDSIFTIGLMCQSWIHLHCRFHTSTVT